MAWAVPAGFALHAMITHWVAVPLVDEWETPGAQLASFCRGSLSWADLFAQHNEHRLLVPRLIWLSLAILAGWDVRYEMALTFFFVCVGAVGLYKLLQIGGAPAGTRLILCLLLSLLLFSPRGYDTFLVGAQGQTFIPTIALVFALVINVGESSLAKKALLNGLLAFISTYSFGNGMLIWLFGFPIAGSVAASSGQSQRRTRLRWGLFYVAAGALSIGLYFVSYRHPSLSPPLVTPLAQSAAFGRFILVWIGALFSVKAPATFGALLLAAFAGLTLIALRQIRRAGNWQRHYPWLVLGTYTLASAAIAAIARLGFPGSMAADSRYTTFSSFFYIALVGLAFSILNHNDAAQRVAARVSALVVLVGVLALWIITLGPERRFLRADRVVRQHLALIVRWSDAIPGNPELTLVSSLYPVHETLDTIRAVASKDLLRPRLVSPALARQLQNLPRALDSSAGVLEEATVDATGQLTCKGWGRNPGMNRAPDCVVVGFEKEGQAWEPFSVFETGNGGFSRTIIGKTLPPSGATLRACAVDLEREQLFPLAGEIKLP